MADIVLDTFTEASSTALESHTADVGGAWSRHPAFATGAATVGAGTGKVVVTGGPPAPVFINAAVPPSADYSVAATITVGDSGAIAGVVGRANATLHNYYQAFFYNGSLFLGKYVGGTATTLSSKAYALTPGTPYTIELVMAGSSLTAKVNGTTELTATDAVITTAGLSGVVGMNGTFDSMNSSYTAAVSTITLSDLVDLRVIQRTGTSASVTLSGTYVGTPASIQARVIRHDTSAEVVAWSTLVASPSGGTFSGTLTVPQGGWYLAQVRFSNDTAVVSNGANRWGVGAIISIAGQSNGANLFSVGTGSAGTLAVKYATAWAAATGAGAIAMANSLATGLGFPVALVDASTSGAALTLAADRGFGNWITLGGAPYTTWTSRMTAVGGKAEAIVWLQGETDALENTSQAAYTADLATLFGRLRSHLAQPTVPIMIVPLGRNTVDSTDAAWDAINDALLAAVTATQPHACDVWDLSRADGYHYDATSYATLGGRLANAVRKYLGAAVESLGPSIGGFVVSGAQVDITLTHRSGTDISPSTAITGLKFTDNGTPVVPSSVVRQSATVVRATFGASLTGPVRVAVAAGKAPTITGALVDSAGLPAQKTASIGVTGDTVDTTSPTMTGSIASSAITTTSYTINGWGATDNVAVTGYELSLDGGSTYVDIGLVTTRNVTGRTPGATDAVRVRAYDAAGNRATPLSASVTLSAGSGARFATLVLTTDGTTPAASLSALKWAWFDETVPNLFQAPTAQGTGATTDPSGTFSVSIAGTALNVGDVGWLIVTDSTGSPTQSPPHKAFSGPVVVA